MCRLPGRIVLLAAAAALLLSSPAIAARGFRHGVAAGEVTSKSAVLWAHANRSGKYTVQIARDRRLRRGARRRTVRARRADDNTVQIKVRRLTSGRRYWYRFIRRRARSAVGTFVTAPAPGRSVVVEFAWTGDTDLGSAPGKRAPFWNKGGVFRGMRAERNDFNIHLGDTMYSDSEIPGRRRPIALTVPAKWAKYKVNLGNGPLRRLRSSAGFYSQWDDHEFVNDFSPAEKTFSGGVRINGRVLYRRGVRAFRDYAPVSYSRRNGLYRAMRWGRNLELFFLDERSFRSAKADEGRVCDNAQTGEPDLVPTMPQSTRNLFAPLRPSLAQPVAPACLEAIRSERRTFLGKRQLSRFLRDVRRSSARFKVIVNETPIQQYYAQPYDRWEGYEAERQQVLRVLQGVDNVVFLSTDVHATLVNDARFQTLEPGGPINSGILDVTVGPAATANFAREVERATGAPGTAGLVDTVVLEGQPPTGVGMQCAIINRFSYGEVRVTADTLTITPKGIDGRPQPGDGRPCGPFVVRAEG
jgi:phosphodiesterase/alkaline phosphatase D-like protein